MKNLFFVFIITIFSFAQAFAVNTNPEKPCDILKLTDGRQVEVLILRTTDEKVFFAHCGDENRTERSLHLKFVESIIDKNSDKEFTIEKNETKSTVIERTSIFSKKNKMSKRDKGALKTIVAVTTSAVAVGVVGVIVAGVVALLPVAAGVYVLYVVFSNVDN